MPIAKINGININYHVEGTGEPLVMIMGFSGDLSGWRYQTPVLKKHFQLITFDNRGVGKSDKPPAPYSIEMMAEDTFGLMDYLNIKQAHIMGVSMGGTIAEEMAITRPDRVLKLILASTHAGTDNRLNGGTKEIIEAWDLPVRSLTKRLLGLCCNKPLNRLVFVPLLRLRINRLGEAEATGLLGQREAAREYHALDRLPLIKAHTLVIAGSADRVVKPSSSDVLAERIPHARLVKIKGGSHMVGFEMKNVFNREVLKFLTST